MRWTKPTRIYRRVKSPRGPQHHAALYTSGAPGGIDMYIGGRKHMNGPEVDFGGQPFAAPNGATASGRKSIRKHEERSRVLAALRVPTS